MDEGEVWRGITEEEQELVVTHLQTEVYAFKQRIEEGYIMQPMNRPVPGYREAAELFDRYVQVYSRALYTEDHLRAIAAWLQEHNSTTPERDGAYEDWLIPAGVYEVDIQMLKRLESLAEHLRSRIQQAGVRLRLMDASGPLHGAAGHMINVRDSLNKAVNAAEAELERRRKG